MKEYKLSTAEARELATKIAIDFNKINTPDVEFKKWASEYMSTYNKVMNAFEPYTD